MPCSYLAKNGAKVSFDLDAVTDVALGYSGARPSWTATLIYVWAHKTFVELRSSPQDIRGNCQSEEVEVDERYITEAFLLSPAQINAVKQDPRNWSSVDHRQRA